MTRNCSNSLPLLVLLPCLGGCLFTGPMWRDANERDLVEPVITGVLEPAAGGDGAPAETSRLLLVRYSSGGEDLFTTVPLTPDGCPADPFGYAGGRRKPEEIVADLPPSQRQGLRAARLTFHDRGWAERVMAGPGFRKVHWPTDGESVEHDAPVEREDGPEGECRRPAGTVRVRAYRVGRPWTEAEEQAMPWPVGRPVEYPADACVLVLPYAQPRPAGNRRAAQARAALWTPVTLLGDAVGVPYITIMCYVFGLCP